MYIYTNKCAHVNSKMIDGNTMLFGKLNIETVHIPGSVNLMISNWRNRFKNIVDIGGKKIKNVWWMNL